MEKRRQAIKFTDFGYLQAKNLLTRGILLNEVLICMLLRQLRECMIESLGDRYVKQTCSLFLDDL